MRYQTITEKQFINNHEHCLIVPVVDNKLTIPALTAFDAAHEKLLNNLIKSKVLGDSFGNTLLIPSAHKQSPAILLVNAGKAKRLTRPHLRKLTQNIAKTLLESQVKSIIHPLGQLATTDGSFFWQLRDTLYCLEQALYKFQTFKSQPSAMPTLTTIITLVETSAQAKLAKQAISEHQALIKAIYLARELGDTPPNICTPTYLAQRAKQLAKTHTKLSVQILEESHMKKLNMNALLSVSQGSKQPAKLIIMEYKGSPKKSDAPYVLVGKGITFDTGGISLKQAKGMEEMKYDMMGAASVMATLDACCQFHLPINLTVVIATAENFPAETATKPSDVVTSMSGKTIEITNTDAEGRLILCDALTYVGKFNPKVVIDVATLTGAMIVALGATYTGVFANDETLANSLLDSGKRTQDLAWRMPIHQDFHDMMKSDIADLRNSHRQSPTAGSGCAAAFLAEFTEKYHWAHLDIAGVAWISTPTLATGRPIALLFDYLLQAASSKPRDTL